MTEDEQKHESDKDYTKALIISFLGVAIITLIFVVSSAGTLYPTADQEFDEIYEIEDNFTRSMEIGVADGILYTDYSTDEVNLKMTDEEGAQVMEYEKNNGKLTVKESYNKSIETVETSQGKLKTGYNDGKQIYEFRGYNRTLVESRRDQLKEDLEQIMTAIDNERESIEEQKLPDIELGINKQDDEDTYFELTNEENEAVNLENWMLEGMESETSSRDAEHTFEPITLEPDETLKVYTESDNEISEDEGYVIADEMTIYSSQSDTVVLYNNWRDEITRQSYNQ